MIRILIETSSRVSDRMARQPVRGAQLPGVLRRVPYDVRHHGPCVPDDTRAQADSGTEESADDGAPRGLTVVIQNSTRYSDAGADGRRTPRVPDRARKCRHGFRGRGSQSVIGTFHGRPDEITRPADAVPDPTADSMHGSSIISNRESDP